MLFRAAVGSLLCLLACSVNTLAQNSDVQPPEPLPNADQITASIQEVDAAADLDDVQKASIKQLYQQAAAALESIDKTAADFARFNTMTQDASKDLANVTDELQRLPKQPAPLANSLTLPQLQQMLIEAEADVLRYRGELKKYNDEVTARQLRQRDVPGELDASRKQLADISKQLATAPPENEQPLLTRARRTNLRTQAVLLTGRIAALEKELPAYAATIDLLPKQRDLAGQKLTLAEARQKALVERRNELRLSDLKSQVEDARQGVERAPEPLKPIAETTLAYVTKNQSILRQLKETADARLEAERTLASVKQEYQRARDKVESVGLTDALGILLRSKRGELAKLRGLHHPAVGRRTSVQESQLELPTAQELKLPTAQELQELQLELLELEDARMDLTLIDNATTNILATMELDSGDPKLRSAARKLLEAQRDALDSRLQNQRAYFVSLVALDSAERELIQQIDEYTSYIEGWILWVRSVPPLSISDLGDAADAVRWLSSPAEWLALATAAIEALRRRFLLTGGFGVIFLALVWRQRRFRVRLRELGARAAPRRCREFSVTAEAAVLTVLIAAVWPTLLFFSGWQLVTETSGNNTVQALGWAFVSSGSFLLWIELLRQVLRSQGLAESHFAWPEKTRRLFSRHLRWFSLTTPLVFLIVFLRGQPNVLYHDSLGRFCFLALMACAAFLAIRTLGSAGESSREGTEREPGTVVLKMRSQALLGAVGMPCLLFALASAGYYYSALQLAQRLMESVALAVTLLTVMGLLVRWILIHRRRLTFAQKLAARQRAAHNEAGQSQADFLTEAETAVDLVQVTRQTSELVRVLVIVAAFVVGWWIWADVLPAFEFLASVEAWRLNLPSRIEIITLKHLFLSALTFGLTFVAAKNIPGLLELLFLQRLPLDAGARYAVTTIVRYVLALLGVIIGFEFIKVQWSQYTWLVAAATFGLGFGLQEIVANFISGLIVLLERPIRVGDVVTVDGITGVVQRIHMRATVLRNWDHQELIVPNKEFVTTKLLNWTLSNSTNRVVVNVGIAYGSDANRARDLMLQVVNEHPNILEEPVPSVTFEEFGDSTLNYVIRCYIPQLDGRLATINDLHVGIHQRLQAAGIEIAFPQRDLHLRTVPPSWQPEPVTKLPVEPGDATLSSGSA